MGLVRCIAAGALATAALVACAASAPDANVTPGSTAATTLPPAATATPTSPPATGPIVGPIAPTTSTPIRKGGPPSTVVPQEDLLLNAVKGTWKGDAGTLTFADDGTATFELRDCPLQSDGPSFGYSTSCATRTLRGRVSVGALTLVLSDPDGGAPIAFGMYMDGDGRLHLGSGGAFSASPTLQAEILLGLEPKDGVIEVDEDRCTRNDQVVPCQWTTRDGMQILVVDGRVYIYEKDLDLIASPQAHYQTFSR